MFIMCLIKVNYLFFLNKQMCRGIFYNSKHALCSIWESGNMVYNILNKSSKYTLDYSEDTTFDTTYDFIVVNWHFVVNNWITRDILKEYVGKTYCIVTEIGLDDLFIRTPKIFNYYLFLDPSITDDPIQYIYGFPRPLEPYLSESEKVTPEIVTVGSFGFATHGKQWDLIIDTVCKEFDTAIIRFNIPHATYIGYKLQNKTINMIQNKIATIKPSIKIELTQINMTKEEIIKWCGENTINCFFYDRYKLGFKHGLCAVTDQAISAGKPILTTNDPTFRHITKYIKAFPEITIKDAINTNNISQMRDGWHPDKFLTKFESLLPSGI